MSIKILLYDWEEDPRSGYFRGFFSSEMHMIINIGSKQITIEVSTSHSTILIEIAAGLVEMFKNNEGYSFDVLGFGTTYNYIFTSKNDKIKIDAFDLMYDKVDESILYDKMKFARDYVHALKSYLKWAESINPRIKVDETFKLIEQYMNNLENVIAEK
ncbi:MAG: ribonucleoside-triphosphate reductase [Brockia lithotrophica]|nr:ribonucleoside-triphosphate reductase [Brockia lithotrophica]